jgi:DNA end-binding protein Ku
MVILDDEDLADLPASSSREISVEKFVPSEQIDPMWLEKSYYLEPDKAAAKPYALLREALKEADRVAVVTVSIRTRMTTAVLRVRDDVIVMQTMLWPDEVRKADFSGLSATEHAAKPQELKMARLLVDTLAGDYDPDDYEDDYQRAVEALVQAKLEGGEVTAPEEPKKATGEVVDLLAALQRSVDAAKSSRGEASSGPAAQGSGAADDASDDEAGDEDAADRPAERGGTKKAASKKSAAKTSTTARSTSGRSTSGKSTSKKAAEKKPAAKKTTKKAVAKKAS